MTFNTMNNQDTSHGFRGAKGIVKILFLLFLIAATIFILRKQQEMPYRKHTGEIFGTIYHISYQWDKDLQNDILRQLQAVDNTFSTFKEQSIIAKINRNEAVKTNAMFNEVYHLSQQIANETNGAFDITVAPLVNAWGFGFKTEKSPTAQTIDSIRAFVGYNKIKLYGNTIKKEDARTMIDCSAVAKGYGVDAVAQLLRIIGVRNFMIEIGGEIVVSGLNDKQKPWRVGVLKPIDDATQTSNQWQTVLELTNKAMATSGNYRKFYYKNGKKYAHTIDPKTGYPVQHNILSATVLAKTCAQADAYATAFMVMGLEKTKEILAQHPELHAYLIYEDQQGKLQVWQKK